MNTVRNKCVCLISGGLDSAVVAALALKNGLELNFLTGDYGQVTRLKELECARKLADYYQVSAARTIDLQWLRDFGGSGLTDVRIYLSKGNAELEYVPFRNTVLLAAAVAWAEVLQAESVFIGSTGPPWHTPDNSPEYIRAMQEVVRLGTKLRQDISLRAPFCNSKKIEVVELGLSLNVPFQLTWSCHNDNILACGQCSNCLDRLQAFRDLGAVDPIPYRKRL